MERALDLGLLAAALGGPQRIPTPEELQQLMADIEVQLFLRRASISPELLDAAWYLHAVASVDRPASGTRRTAAAGVRGQRPHLRPRAAPGRATA